MLHISKQLTLLVLLFLVFNLIQPAAIAATRIEPNSGGPTGALDAANVNRDYLHALKHESDGSPFTPAQYRNWKPGDTLIIPDDAKPDHLASWLLIAEDARLHGKKDHKPSPNPGAPPAPTCPPPVTPSTAALDAANARTRQLETEKSELGKRVDDLLVSERLKAREINSLKAETAKIPSLLARISELERLLKAKSAPAPAPRKATPPTKGGSNGGLVLLSILLLSVLLAGLLIYRRSGNNPQPQDQQQYTLTGQAIPTPSAASRPTPRNAPAPTRRIPRRRWVV